VTGIAAEPRVLLETLRIAATSGFATDGGV